MSEFNHTWEIPLWVPRYVPELERFYLHRTQQSGFERLEMPFHTVEAAQIVADMINSDLKEATNRAVRERYKRLLGYPD